jgi:hypothetical protein
MSEWQSPHPIVGLPGDQGRERSANASGLFGLRRASAIASVRALREVEAI